jgi:acetoin utilization deacetylase AcuC-like enzyme
MKAMKALASDHFVLPLPAGHRFPMSKYRLLRARVEAELAQCIVVQEAPQVSEADLLRVHEPAYVQRVLQGTLSAAEQREIGFPWSELMVQRSLRSAGATLAAARIALEGDGVAANLAGGTHHAYAHKGSGFCVFNDAAIAIRALQADGSITHAAVIDLDVHQGNGTAAIFAGEASVFTLSMHGDKNFPFRKEQSCLDVALPDGTGDRDYLKALDDALASLWQHFTPDLIIYLAGADPYEHDRLGRLKLTQAGLLARDKRVMQAALDRGIPIAVTMAGGYCVQIDETVQIQFNTISLAQQFHEQYEQQQTRRNIA